MLNVLCAVLVCFPTSSDAQEMAMALLAPSPVPKTSTRDHSASIGQEVVISFGGDVNFARSRQTPRPDRVLKFGNLPIERFTEVLSKEWTGDVNFVNVETVVSARNGSPSGSKAFVFRSHPEQFRHLIGLGVNAFALANNHAYDHGRLGMRDTLQFFEDADRPETPLLYSGIGRGEDAYAPSVITSNGLRIAMSSASFGSGSFAPVGTEVGMAYSTVPAHYAAILKGLREVEADLKILSIHYGTENYVGLNPGQRAKFRRAIEEAGVHLVLGHHPHVVRAVEHDPGSGAAIFYSLGNLLFIGGAAKDNDAVGRDYGLLGRAYFTKTQTGTRLTALEAIPLKGVHHIPRHPQSRRARAILANLNALSRNSLRNGAVNFSITNPERPRGLACFAAEPFGPRARKLCCADVTHAQCNFPDLM